jgi:hypothetical protein
MMVSLSSALIIANTPVEAFFDGPDEKGKYQGIIGHSKDHPHHPYMPILSSHFLYDSPDDATEAMKEQIKLITADVEEKMKST